MAGNNNATIDSSLRIAITGCGVMVLLKAAAYFFTESAAVFADITQSLVHLAALGFASFSLRYANQPSVTKRSPEQPNFILFSSGFEGSMIIFAGLVTVFVALAKYFAGEELNHIEAGTLLTVVSAGISSLFGFYLLREGRSQRSVVMQSNGKHLLFSCILSLVVISSLLFYSYAEGYHWIDPLAAALLGIYTFFSGIITLRKSFDGLLDKADPHIIRQLTEVLSTACSKNGIRFGQLNHAKAGDQHWIEATLFFPPETEIAEAHRMASEVEVLIISVLSNRAHIILTLQAEKASTKTNAPIRIS